MATSAEKLQAFVVAAAKGEIEAVPELGRRLFSTALALDRKLLQKIGAQKPENIDDAMLEVANVALRIRSDDAPPFRVVLAEDGEHELQKAEGQLADVVELERDAGRR